MEIFVLGLNYRTAGVEDLERAFIPDTALEPSLKEIRASGALQEIVLLSTCNRVEAYGMTYDGEHSKTDVKAFFQQKSGIPLNHLRKLLYEHSQAHAVRHLFRVASSLDSMVVGEPEILGQVKKAYEKAASCDCTGKILNHLFSKAFKIAKRVRSETEISRNAVSIASVCVQLGTKILSGLSEKSILLMGAGEIAEQIGAHLAKYRPKALYVANRTHSRAVALARRLHAVPVKDIRPALLKVDIVICSTSSPQFLMTRDQISQLMKNRRKRPLFLIDVSVPRDIDPEAQDLENVYLFNIDDLGRIAAANREKRKREAQRALSLIDNEVSRFVSWLNRLEIEPVISTLKRKIEALCEEEISRCIRGLRKMQSDEDAARVFAKSLARKILHDPIAVLKENAEEAENPYAEAASRLFRLG